MNLNFCRLRCGRCSHPEFITLGNSKEWILVMKSQEGEYGQDRRLEIEEPSAELLSAVKPYALSMYAIDYDELCRLMWGVRMRPGSDCPFLTEHTMYDIAHEERKKELNRMKKMLGGSDDEDAK